MRILSVTLHEKQKKECFPRSMRVNILTFATAHPAKFPEVFNDVEGFEENIPLELKNIFEKQQKFVKLNDKYEDIADFISSNYAS